MDRPAVDPTISKGILCPRTQLTPGTPEDLKPDIRYSDSLVSDLLLSNLKDRQARGVLSFLPDLVLNKTFNPVYGTGTIMYHFK
jgi:hypothetical protein